MRKKIFNILLFIIVLVAVGCTKDGSGAPKAFKNQTDICLMSDGNVIMSYDVARCQLSFNRKRGMFRVGNDDMSEYFMLRAEEGSGFELVEGQTFIGDLTYCAGGKVTEVPDQTWEIISFLTDDYGTKVRLWCNDKKIGAVMYAVK